MGPVLAGGCPCSAGCSGVNGHWTITSVDLRTMVLMSPAELNFLLKPLDQPCMNYCNDLHTGVYEFICSSQINNKGEWRKWGY